MRTKLIVLVLVMLSLLVVPAHAETPDDRGYWWSLTFDFENDFNGVLTLQVGPWKNGTLVSVDETSSTRVVCQRIGPVHLVGGEAHFTGGHLRCELDLAAILKAKHGIDAGTTDHYPGMVMRTRLATSTFIDAPIFTHADAVYRIDFSQTNQVTLRQHLATLAGPVNATAIIPGAIGTAKQTYTMLYSCDLAGPPCAADMAAGPQVANLPLVGDHIRFRTGPTSILVGGDGLTTFQGAIESLLIDPGNSFPK